MPMPTPEWSDIGQVLMLLMAVWGVGYYWGWIEKAAEQSMRMFEET